MKYLKPIIASFILTFFANCSKDDSLGKNVNIETLINEKVGDFEIKDMGFSIWLYASVGAGYYKQWSSDIQKIQNNKVVLSLIKDVDEHIVHTFSFLLADKMQLNVKQGVDLSGGEFNDVDKKVKINIKDTNIVKLKKDKIKNKFSTGFQPLKEGTTTMSFEFTDIQNNITFKRNFELEVKDYEKVTESDFI